MLPSLQSDAFTDIADQISLQCTTYWIKISGIGGIPGTRVRGQNFNGAGKKVAAVVNMCRGAALMGPG